MKGVPARVPRDCPLGGGLRAEPPKLSDFCKNRFIFEKENASLPSSRSPAERIWLRESGALISRVISKGN